MNITPVEQIPTAIDLAVNMRAHLLQLRTTFTKPFLVIIYEHRSLLRPTLHSSSLRLTSTLLQLGAMFFHLSNHTSTTSITQRLKFLKKSCATLPTTFATNYTPSSFVSTKFAVFVSAQLQQETLYKL